MDLVGAKQFTTRPGLSGTEHEPEQCVLQCDSGNNNDNVGVIGEVANRPRLNKTDLKLVDFNVHL